MNSRISNLYIGNPNTRDSTVDERLAVADSVVTFAALHSDTKYCVLDIQTADVMATFDGSNPTTSNGHLLKAEQGLITMSANAVKALKLIRASGTSAAIHLTQFED